MTETIDSLVLEDYSGTDDNEPHNLSIEVNQKNLVDRMAQQFSISILEEALKAASLRAESSQIPTPYIPRTVDLENLIKHASKPESKPAEECPKVSQKSNEHPHTRERSSTQVILYQPPPVFQFPLKSQNLVVSDITSIETREILSSNFDESRPPSSIINDDLNQIGQYKSESIKDDTIPNSSKILEYSNLVKSKDDFASIDSAKRNLPFEDNLNQKSIQSLETLQQNLTDSQTESSAIPATKSSASPVTILKRSDSLDSRYQVKESKLDGKILNHMPFNQHPISGISESISKKRRSEDISHPSPSVQSKERKNNIQEVIGTHRKIDSDKSKSSQAWEEPISLEKTESKHVSFNSVESNKVRHSLESSKVRFK